MSALAWYNPLMSTPTVEFDSSIVERLLDSPEKADALLSLRFNDTDEARMQELMEKNNRGTMSRAEQSEMESYRKVGTFLAILQAQARLQGKNATNTASPE